MNKRLIIGNWKMNPETREEAKVIARKTRSVVKDLRHTDAVICPPFVFIQNCLSSSEPSLLPVGAQNVSFYDNGAHTGEISVSMLRDVGVEYVIVGHSEQRAVGDTDENICRRIKVVLDDGLVPVVCVGEKKRDESGAYLETLKTQITQTFGDVLKKYSRDIVIAYEPLWAIGATEPMSSSQIYEMSLFVKKVFADIFGPDAGIKVRVLYGGAVNAGNAADIISIGKVDGLLVGRESVNISGFAELLRAVDSVGEM